MHFALYDVFCDHPLSGNPAAVIFSEAPFKRELLVAFAQEFNLPETCNYWIEHGNPHVTFATSKGVINVCGHGILAVLADAALNSRCEVSKELSFVIQNQPTSLWKYHKLDGRTVFVSVKWPKSPTFHKELPVEEAAEVLRVRRDEIRTDLPLTSYDSGIINGLVPIGNVGNLLEIKPDYGSVMSDFFRDHNLDDLHLYSIEDMSAKSCGYYKIRARNVFPYGVREESGTGSASISLAYALSERFGEKAAEFHFIQGLDRKSAITVKLLKGPGREKGIWLEGKVILIASGENLLTPDDWIDK